MRRFLLLTFILILFIIAMQLALLGWLSVPAPHYPVFAETQFEVIAHQSGAGLSPPNTLTAMRTALEVGTDVLEMDIHMSRDGHIMVIHDQTLDRTTSCSGKVMDKTLAELQACDKGFYFRPAKAFHYPYRGADVRIPTLHDVFTTFPAQRMIIEMKQDEPSLVSKFCQLLRSFNVQDYVVVGSFRQKSMDEFREACPEVATSATPKEATKFILAAKIGLSGIISPVYAALQIPPAIKPPGVRFLPDFNIITPSLVEAAHKKGVVVQAWTINETSQMKSLLAMGVDGIMTDYPDRLVDAALQHR